MDPPGDDPWPPLAARAAAFDRMYTEQPARFTGPPSRFSAWATEIAHRWVPRGRVLDLGCGLGRDARRFAEAGYDVRATDYSGVAIRRARAGPAIPSNLRFEQADAVSALAGEPDGGRDIVYSHALYMMLSDAELADVFRGVRRVLRPGGLHLYAVRSTTDPIAGQGEEVAPDVWRREPPLGVAGPRVPHRYFRESTIDTWTATGFERVAREHPPELHFWFVADRRP